MSGLSERLLRGVLSSHPWVTTINSLLWFLSSEDFKPVFYADDTAMLLIRTRGLNDHLNKSEKCLFTRKRNIIGFDEHIFLRKMVYI